MTMINSIKRALSLVSVIIAAVFLVSCAQVATQSGTPTTFRNSQYNVVLGFDLSDDRHPLAIVTIKGTTPVSPEKYTLALPFEAEQVENDPRIFSTWGSYRSTLMINYVQFQSSSETYAIVITPKFAEISDSNPNPSDLNESLYFIRSGLERIFIYKYPDVDSNKLSWRQEVGGVTNAEIQSIGMLLPQGAIGQEIRSTGLTANPLHIFIEGNIKYYPGLGRGLVNSSGDKIEALEIRYQLPPSSSQQSFAEFIAKFMGVIIIPFVQFIVNRPKSAGGTKYRKIIIWSAAALQGVILSTLIILAILSGDGTIGKIIGDTFIVVIGAAATGYVLYQEKKNS